MDTNIDVQITEKKNLNLQKQLLQKQLKEIDNQIIQINEYLQEYCPHKLREYVWYDGHRNVRNYVCTSCNIDMNYNSKYQIVETVYEH